MLDEYAYAIAVPRSVRRNAREVGAGDGQLEQELGRNATETEVGGTSWHPSLREYRQDVALDTNNSQLFRR